jgi:hypothetical protein
MTDVELIPYNKYNWKSLYQGLTFFFVQIKVQTASMV